MPYIAPERRPRIARGVEDALAGVETPGDLNYAITKLCLGYLTREGRSYQRYNEVMGVLTCAGHELYRRHVAAYETDAQARHGDVQ